MAAKIRTINVIRASFSHEELMPGATIEISLIGVSERFYNYMSLISDATDPDTFSSPAAGIKGNITNINAAGSTALGYFRLCESDHI